MCVCVCVCVEEDDIMHFPIYVFSTALDVASDLCFSPSNKMLMISVGMDAQVKCYDIQTRK